MKTACLILNATQRRSNALLHTVLRMMNALVLGHAIKESVNLKDNVVIAAKMMMTVKGRISVMLS